MPEITVLIPLYNEKREIVKLALDSILGQTLSDIFVSIRLDNPENEELEAYIKNRMEEDERIQFAVNEKNLGLPATLNIMISEVSTKYVARMDADDISFDKRLAVQYSFMINHPQVDLCGTNIIYINQDGNIVGKNETIPETNEFIKKGLKYKNVMSHPTYFAKTDLMKKLKYRETLRYAQDYDFVCRCIESGHILANIDDNLLYYRVGNVSSSKFLRQSMTAYYVRKYYRSGILCEKNDIAQDIENEIRKKGEERLIDGVNSRKIFNNIKECVIKRDFVGILDFVRILVCPHRYKVDLWISNILYKFVMR